jgi:hypothetical protein
VAPLTNTEKGFPKTGHSREASRANRTIIHTALDKRMLSAKL